MRLHIGKRKFRGSRSVHDNSISGIGEIGPELADEFFGQIEGGVSGRPGLESGDNNFERGLALHKHRRALGGFQDRCQFLTVQFAVIRRVDGHHFSAAKKVLRKQMRCAVSNVPVFRPLVRVREEPLPYGVDFEVSEAQPALKLGANCRFAGARRATDNDQHAVIVSAPSKVSSNRLEQDRQDVFVVGDEVNLEGHAVVELRGIRRGGDPHSGTPKMPSS